MKRRYIFTALLLLAALLTVGCMRNADETEPEAETDPPVVKTDPETGPEIEPETESETEPDPEPETEPETEETRGPAFLEDDGTGRVHTISLDKYTVEITEGLSDMPWVTMLPAENTDKSEIWTTSDAAVATVDPYGRIKGVAPGQCIVTVTSAARPELFVEIPVTVYPRKDVQEPTYIDGILIANKTYALPSNYNPGVDKEAQQALNDMIAAAADENIYLYMISGFRSYETQLTLYNNYVARDGKDAADRYSARPGHSEHQSGLCFDLNSLEQSFGQTAEGIWLVQHCAEYGFIIRYPADKEEITGYMYEPWHVRYLGKEVARAVTESGLCLEEYLQIDSQYEN